MDTQIKKNARIVNPNGKEVGAITRFVLDPKSKKVAYLIFERGMLHRNEYVLPMDEVDRVESDRIVLRNNLERPEELTPFQESHYIPAPDINAMSDSPFIAGGPNMRMYYYYPPATGANYGTLRDGDPGTRRPAFLGTNSVSPIPVSGADEVGDYIEQEQENIPPDTATLNVGAKVISADGEHVGNVEELAIDTRSDRITHLLVARGILFKATRVIPVDWIDWVDDDEVHLVMDSGFLATLPDQKEP